MQSCVLILPVALRAKGNALAAAMGWGPDNYGVPLSVNGASPATHYGLHSWVGPEFVAMLATAESGVMPDALTGYPPADFAAVVGGLTASIRQESQGHFGDVCDAEGLGVIVPAG